MKGSGHRARFIGVLAILLPWHRRAAERRPALGALNVTILLEPCAAVEGATTAHCRANAAYGRAIPHPRLEHATRARD